MSEQLQESIDPIGEGSEFDHGYRNLLHAVDIVEGDNPYSDSIADHGMVDADMRKHDLPPPGVYADKGGDAADIISKQDLFELATRLRNILNTNPTIDEDRKGVLLREIGVAELRLRYSLGGNATPAFNETWRMVTGKDAPELGQFKGEIDATRDHMLALLAQEGVHVTNPKTMSDNVRAWEHSKPHLGSGDDARIKEIITDAVTQFIDRAKKVIAERVPALRNVVSQIDTSAYTLNVLPEMSFDAGLSYIGSTNTKPATGAANFEWNAGRPATETDIRYVAEHEATHWLNAFCMDIQRRAGKLGPESALLTMSSPRAVNEEGLAQVMKEMLHGGTLQNVVDDCGPEMGIVMLQDRLQDIARMVAAVGWNQEFAGIEDGFQRRMTIRDYIEKRLLQTEHIGFKYGGKRDPDATPREQKKFWRQLPGGMCYAPAYYEGSRAYRTAINTAGVDATLAVGMHSEGLVDGQAFKDKIDRKVREAA
ncbi:hypothetical protein KBD59_03925 [Candidatus Gracilibacteria bacterium]|nr:hypothetical protein [Candidatus Gracilibacteria bacterium]